MKNTASRLLAFAAGCAAPDAEEAPSAAAATPGFAALSDREAWERVPRDTAPLPVWARMQVDSLPRTTALQLELDWVQRTKNPLGPVLASRIRWAVADANRCEYAQESAEADLVRAGLTPEQAQQHDDVPQSDRLAVSFARDLTLAAAAITDATVAQLIEAYGPDDAVAIVHTVAYANFQNRIFLALGLTAEPGGPLPPRAVGPTAEDMAAAPPRSEAGADARYDAKDAPASWRERSFADLRSELDRQKLRPSRIPPADAARLARLPRPDRERVAGTTWGKVSMGYQPVLTSAWFQTMRAFESEAALDDVFANTVFWVVTRANDCFY